MFIRLVTLRLQAIDEACSISVKQILRQNGLSLVLGLFLTIFLVGQAIAGYYSSGAGPISIAAVCKVGHSAHQKFYSNAPDSFQKLFDRPIEAVALLRIVHVNGCRDRRKHLKACLPHQAWDAHLYCDGSQIAPKHLPHDAVKPSQVPTALAVFSDL